MRSFVILIFAIFASPLAAQPGEYGNLTVNVVDGNGAPIGESMVLQASVRERGYTIEGHGPFQDTWFKPRDARRSSFIGEIVCGGRFSVAVSAPGYRTKIESSRAERCPAEVSVVLERDGNPVPPPRRLTRISGTLTAHAGLYLDGAFRLKQDQLTYIPRIRSDGQFSFELPPGIFNIEFAHYKCSQYLITGYRIGPEPRILPIDANCAP
jgi:hypothetical protein